MKTVADQLRHTVRTAAERLRQMPETDAALARVPGKWSPKQIIGHLIDSASNNHQRFVRARFQEHLRFNGYDQDAWVVAQRYDCAAWPVLITLWEHFNLHLADVMEATPEDVLSKKHHDHNLDQIAWEIIPKDEPASLDYFMCDYVGHLCHHLRQIDPTLASAPRRQRAS